jgi:glycosyltransferase involved in cell wall biosynthesis
MVEYHRPQRVLYVVSRFPCISTTFTANEMAVIASEGVEVWIAPIWKTLPNYTPHELEKPLLPNVIRPKWHKPGTWLKLLKGLIRQPRVLWLIARLFPGHLKSIYLPPKLLSAIPRGLYLGQWCVENRIDHIHAHFLTSPTTVALIASMISGIPYSFTGHAHDITSHRPHNVSGSVKLKLRHAAFGVTISHYNHRYMLEHWPKSANVDVLYNGIDTERFRASENRQVRNGQPWRVMSVSRLVEKKGYEFLIRAVAQLYRQGVAIRLDIFGDGNQRQALQNLIERLEANAYITLHGTILQEALSDKFRHADVFALACVLLPQGDSDGLPTVLIEALASELPTISTQVTGIPEIIQDGITGLCVPPGDVQRLAEAILWMLDHPEAAQAMGRRGRQLVLEQFDRRKNARLLLTRWRELYTAS